MILPGLFTERTSELIKSIYTLAQGGSNAVGSITLTANTTTTTVTDPYMSTTSKVMMSPTTSNAAAAVGTTYVSTKAMGSFILTHANNAQTDRTFDYEIRGN